MRRIIYKNSICSRLYQSAGERNPDAIRIKVYVQLFYGRIAFVAKDKKIDMWTCVFLFGEVNRKVESIFRGG